MILIGSRALKHYGKLHGREPADWDLLTLDTKDKLIISGETCEMSSAKDPENATNAFLYLYSMYMSDEKVMTPAGKAIVAPLDVLKTLKIASAPHLQKAKHSWDLHALEGVTLCEVLERVAKVRSQEIKARVDAQKAIFFNKYNIKRYIEHDRLHTFVNSSPAYMYALKDAVNISREAFLDLALTHQVRIIREEALVLALERELIPQVIRMPNLALAFYSKFTKVQTSSDPAMRWISRLSIPGKLKDHPEWLAIWAEWNAKHILAGLEEWWQETLAALPKEFWTEILSIAHKETHETTEESNAG